MELRLTKPEIERFIETKVERGEFPTREAVVEDAIARMMDEEIALSDEDRAVFRESDEQIDRGESIDFDTFAAEARARYGIKRNG